MRKIPFLVGSLRSDSLNKRLSRVAEQMLPEGFEAVRFDLSSIPLYNGDPKDDLTPASVQDLHGSIDRTDGVFWTTPEYNFAFPGVVKNVLDWASRPMLPRNSIVGKPINVAVATVSATNGIRALADLKRIWGNSGGLPINGFDFVLQQAPSKFLEENGRDVLEPVSRATLRFNIDNLVRAIETDAGSLPSVNWDAFVESMA